MTLYAISLQVEVLIVNDAGVYLQEHSPVRDGQILLALQRDMPYQNLTHDLNKEKQRQSQ